MKRILIQKEAQRGMGIEFPFDTCCDLKVSEVLEKEGNRKLSWCLNTTPKDPWDVEGIHLWGLDLTFLENDRAILPKAAQGNRGGATSDLGRLFPQSLWYLTHIL